MLRLSIFEFLLRVIPEGFVLMFALFAICNVKIQINRYIISSILLGVFQYTIRLLPINYGVNTILGIFVMVIIMYIINKADIVLTIKASLIITIILFICEWINVFLLHMIFRERLEEIMVNGVSKTICGLPSLMCFTIIIGIYYCKKRRK